MKRKCRSGLKSNPHKNLLEITRKALFGILLFSFILNICPMYNAGSVPQSEKTVVLAASKKVIPSKLYKKIKGWWSDNSSGGYNRKITEKYIKAYDRSTGKLAYKSKIYGCKKTKNGYLIKCRYAHNNAKYCYVYNEQSDSMEYYFDSWEARGDNYSGSSSMSRGRW